MNGNRFSAALAIVAALAVSALAVGTASAETTLLAEWLFNGAAFVGALATVTEGTILLNDEGVMLAVNCSVLMDGTVTGGDGVDSTAEVLTLGGVLVTEAKPLKGMGGGCGVDSLSECEEDGELEVFPAKLPWRTLAFLTEGGHFLDAAMGVEWEIRCIDKIFHILRTDICEWPQVSFELLNLVGGNIELMELGLPLGHCTLGGEKADIEFEPGNVLKDTAAGSLTISSEG